MTFTVFGQKPENSICLPHIPYAVRFNCKDGGGGLFVGGSDPQHRRTNPEDKIDINIIKVSKWFGSLGKTQNVLWIQIFFIAAPNVDPKILPSNTVCVGYLKKQSISALFNKVQEAIEYGEPAEGIFTLSFVKELGKEGAYYSVGFDWRERQTASEKKQLELIDRFMAQCGSQLVDLEGTRSLQCVNGMSAEQIQALVEAVDLEVPTEPPKSQLNSKQTRRLAASK
jgi:hypothetical protein